MKKILVISFLTAYLLSATELNQLLKVPFLYEHFSEHRSENVDLTFVQFLKMHYSSQKESTDYKDMKLPFKSHDGGFSASVITAPFTASVQIIEKPVFKEAKAFNHYTEKHLISAYLSNVWQPPKFS